MIVEERVAAYLDALEGTLPEFLKQIEKEALCCEVPIIKKQTQSLLCFLFGLLKPVRILEIGTAVGFSALFMAEYAPENARITTIEKVPARIKQAEENFKAAEVLGKIKWENNTGMDFSRKDGFGKNDLKKEIFLLCGDAVPILQELAQKETEPYDFIFMDAAKGQYLAFYEAAKKLLAPGGLLVSDNVLQEGEIAQSRYAVTRRDRTIHTRMREYLYQLKHTEGLRTTVLTIGDGVALTVKLTGDSK